MHHFCVLHPQLKEINKIAGAANGAYIASATHRLIKWDNEIQIVSNHIYYYLNDLE